MENSVAIVYGAKGVNATGLIRSLGMAGCKVVFASTYTKIESRYVSTYIKLPIEKEKQVHTLLEYIKTLSSKPALFATDDSANFTLDEYYSEFSEISFCPGAKGNLHNISDKTVMSEIARNCGLNVADYIKVCVDEIEECPVDFPVILKPFAGYSGSKGDIRVCRTEDEFHSAIEELIRKQYHEIMVQHLIDCSNQYEIGLMGLALPDGTVEIPCTINKIRSWPIGRGSTSYAQIKDGVCRVNKNNLIKFVQSTGYVGIFDIDMIVAGDAAYFIEINYRNGQYGFAPTAAGYNIPQRWFEGMKGNHTTFSGRINEIYFINEREDFKNVKAGNVSLMQWIKEFRSAEAYGVFCHGDQRPFVRQYLKMPDRLMTRLRNIIKKIEVFFVREEWAVAIRSNEGPLLFEEGGTKKSFRVLPNSFRYWCADPFIISVCENDYLFFEMFDRFKGKGVIGYRVINKKGNISSMKIAYESDKHLSFPFVFEYNKDYYMMPESSYEKKIMLLKAECFPNKWVTNKTWFEGEQFCDSVFLNSQDELYLLTQPVEIPYTHAKLNVYKYDTTSWIGTNNPVVNDSSRARMAGAVIKQNDVLLRPSQDCKTYGDALNFNQILSLDKYTEMCVRKITTTDISISNSKETYRGIHTYNHSNRYEVIDVKRKLKFKCGYLLSFFRVK